LTVEWDQIKILNEITNAAQSASKEIATNTERDIRINLQRHGGGGSISNNINMVKSKFKGGGYLVGVMGPIVGKWEDSIEGKATFFEYGRSARGKATQPTGQRPQQPRPFIRPAKTKNERKANPIYRKFLE